MTLVFFSCFFGTIQCAVISLIAERNVSSWALQPRIRVIAVIYGVWQVLSSYMFEYFKQVCPIFFLSIFYYDSYESIRNSTNWVLETSHFFIERWLTSIQAISGSVIRNSVLAWCLQKKGPVYVALFKPLGTAIAVVMAIIFLGEIPHLGR